MPRRPSLEASLARLAEIARTDAADVAELQGFIEGPHSHAIARAAELAGEQGFAELAPAMTGAFARLMEDPIARDPGCLAKAAIASALHQLDADATPLYLAGIDHRQMEPVWGGREDTAMALRTACGRGLVRARHPDALLHLADALADPEFPVRLGAAQSLAYHGTEHGLPLLRLKIHGGDAEPEVIGECLLATLRIAPETSLGFVAGFLSGDGDTISELAALALGESRAPGAFEVLREWREDADARGLGGTALTAIAMLRTDAALAYLIERVAHEPGPMAREAIAALAIHRSDDGWWARVEDAARRDDVDLREALAKATAE